MNGVHVVVICMRNQTQYIKVPKTLSSSTHFYNQICEHILYSGIFKMATQTYKTMSLKVTIITEIRCAHVCGNMSEIPGDYDVMTK